MVTIKEIAQVVGVSSATVSRVLNYDTTLSISARKRQAIIETAESLNYATPRNRNRGNGAVSPSSTVKIVFVHSLRPADELADPYYIGVRFGIESRAQAYKAEVIKLHPTNTLPDPMILQEASGIIAAGTHSDQEIEWLRQHSRHMVVADVCPPVEAFDCVESDLRYATRQLMDALWDAGYRRIGFMGAKNDYNGPVRPFDERRCSAYREWLNERGLFDPVLCRVGRMSFECGYDLAAEMLALDVPPDVIVAANDNMAIGAYRAIMEKGLSIPRDIGVVGFNDIPAAQFLAPPLSTVKIHAERIGEVAVDLLMEQINGREYVKRVVIATDMVWRESCRAPALSGLND